MKQFSLFLFCIFYLINCFCQNRNNNWYFGIHAGLNFNTVPPSALNNSAMDGYETSASISDNTGNLLFYTNGDSVWNRNHVKMPNGFGLLTGHIHSATQGALIIPKPCDNSIYYIFNLSEDETGPHRFGYSIVDINLDGGLGDVTDKNIVVHQPVTEKLTATLQANGIDYWVAIQERTTGNILLYSLTASGLSLTPVIFNGGGIAPDEWGGYMKFAHDGSKLCTAGGNVNKVKIFDFNKATGAISNQTDLVNTHPYGIEFSPDNSKLYIGSFSPGGLYQYDLLAGSQAAIQSSEIIIATGFVFGPLRLGPDNKIYIARYLHSYIDVIDQPNQAGLTCNLIINAINIAPGSIGFGITNGVDFYSVCNSCPAAVNATTSITICSNQTYSLPSGTIVSSEGIYIDTVRNQASCDSIITTTNVSVFPVNHLNTEAQICSNESYHLPSGAIVHTAGIYNDTLRNISSCDSIINAVHVFVNTVSGTSIIDSIFAGQTYILPSGETVNDAGVYQSVLLNSNGCDSLIRTTLKLKQQVADCIIMTNAITPNGDGINDYWVLYKYNCFKKLEVDVYNRYGSLVYHSDHYKNDWNGKYKNKELPDGTYYYVVKVISFDGREHVFKDNVTILR